MLVVAVNDNVGDLRKFIRDGGYTFPVMLDPGNLGARYGVRAIPTLVLIDSEGNIAQMLVGGATFETLSTMVDDLTR